MPFNASLFTPVLAGLAGEKADPDDMARFKADVVAPAYNVGHKGSIPSVEFGAARGKHVGGRVIGGPGEQGSSPKVVAIEALSAAEKRDIVVYAEEAYAYNLGSTPEASRRIWEAVCVAKTARELMAYNELSLETHLLSGWNATVSAALDADDRFSNTSSSARSSVIDLVQGVEADCLITDQKTDRYLRRHPNYRGQLGDNERDGISQSTLVELIQGDHDRPLKYIVLDAQDDPSQPNNPLVGQSAGLLWAGRLMPNLPRSAVGARDQLLSHNFAFLRGFHTAVSNPALAQGSRLNNRVGDDALNSALAGVTVITVHRDQLKTEITVYSTGKFKTVNSKFGAVLTNTWVAA